MSNWYEEMAAAVRKRETALNGVERWQEKVAAAELEIAELAKKQPQIATGTVTAPAPTTAPTTDVTFQPGIPEQRIPSDYHESAE